MATFNGEEDTTPHRLCDKDESRMIDYLSKTGKYKIELTPTRLPHTPPRVDPPLYLSQPPMPWLSYQQPPRISIFSGETPIPKGEVSFENWTFEVRCLLRDDTYTPTTLIQSIRKSLKGDASRLMFSLGEGATVSDILARLEGLYGTVDKPENLLQRFHQEQQSMTESLSSWGIKLEDLLQQAISRGSHFDAETKDAMLRNKFWTGLRSSHLKDATRHVFYSSIDFMKLMQSVRIIEQELVSAQSPSTKPTRSQHHPHSVTDSSLSTCQESTALSDVMKRLDKLELTQTQRAESKTENKILTQILERLTALESQRDHPPHTYSLRPGRSRGRGWSRGRGHTGGRGHTANDSLNQ